MYQKIIDLCHNINEDIKNTEEYKNYKKYEKICLEKYLYLFDEYKQIQEDYFNYKSFLNEEKIKPYKEKYINKKEELFKIEEIKLYFIYKQKVDEIISDINKKISKAINENVKYINEIGILGGGSCG